MAKKLAAEKAGVAVTDRGFINVSTKMQFELWLLLLMRPISWTSTVALGDQLNEPHQTVSSRGGIGQGTSPWVHSSGGKKDEVDLDADRYFRLLDRALIEYCSKPSGLPLLLVALPEHHHRFRKASNNTSLMTEGLEINPDALDIQTLSERAWTLVEPQYRARQAA